jgi:hypothetical protein
LSCFFSGVFRNNTSGNSIVLLYAPSFNRIDFWKETVGERQSTRQAKKLIRLEDEAHYTDTTINDTPTVEEALAGPQREKWLEAMENERQ